MKRAAIALLLASLFVAVSSIAQADPSEYGFEETTATLSSDEAGGHPDFTTTFSLKRKPNGEPIATAKDISFELPPGLLGNPTVAVTCSAAQFSATDVSIPGTGSSCPVDSQVGITQVELRNAQFSQTFTEPVYNLEPRAGEPARLGFIAENFPVFIETHLRSDGDYGITASAESIGTLIPPIGATTTIWGSPADETHDSERITPYEAIHHSGTPETPTGKRSSGLAPKPFMSNPTRCGQQQGVRFSTTPYALPSLRDEAFVPLPSNFGCGLLEFSPSFSLTPTSGATESSSGLDVELSLPQNGLEQTSLRAASHLKRAEVVLPEGITINPAQAEGLSACTEADFAREAADSLPGAGCPEASKIGSAFAKSPLLDEPAEGALYVAQPYANPFGSLVAIYMVLRIPDRGVIVKVPGKVTLDPRTGQLTTVFGEAPYELPQLPVSLFQLHFRSGPRGPLVTPPACGNYRTIARFTSWADPDAPREIESPFSISRGSDGGPCPAGARPFRPSLAAGSVNNAAGRFSPFELEIARADGEQELSSFSVRLPKGITAKLAGVASCPEAAIAAAAARTGRHGGQEELELPSCPASSEIGHTVARAGTGSILARAPGDIYLAGPYRGALLSVVAITAAKVGPFDLGTVVVRAALRVDPETGEATIEGSQADPLPHIISGVMLHLREIRADVDRPKFTLNPTDCSRFATVATLVGAGSDLGSVADDVSARATSPYQGAGCASLSFRPRLSLRLIGGTHRGSHPALRATLRMDGIGGAAIRRAQVELPRSEFIENAHFNTICTRVQFAAGRTPGEGCPVGSIYGRAKATLPILATPLVGPVYLRSSQHKLPDLVASLSNDQVNIVLDGRVDSVKGRLRTTFAAVPDAPVSSFTLQMQGRKKGLFVNSTDLCQGTHRVTAIFTAHNGKVRKLGPPLRARCGKEARSSSSPPIHKFGAG